MAIKHYIITIDESAMTDALRAQLEALGAEVQEEPIEELDPATAQAIDEALAASARGEKVRTWKEVKAEIEQRRAARNRQSH